MPRKARWSFESASARLKLPIKQNKKPYWERLGPGLSLGYRRSDHAGSWSIRASDGAGGERLKRIGTADDYEAANGKDVLNYEQAVADARRLYRGKNESDHDSSVNRVRNSVRACSELSAPNRSHIWKTGLQTLPNATRPRKLIFPDDVIFSLVGEACRGDAALGLFCHLLAVSGMRPVQAARLRVEDLIGGDKSRLMVSKSAKGGGRNRAEKKLQRYPVPINEGLCERLKQASKSRADHALLLLRADCRPWSEYNPHGDYRQVFGEVARAVGLAPDVTAYLFRHSNIARMSMRGLHTKLVADLHDTSEQMIRQHNGKYIIEHTDEIARAALLHDELPVRVKVIQIRH